MKPRWGCRVCGRFIGIGGYEPCSLKCTIAEIPKDIKEKWDSEDREKTMTNHPTQDPEYWKKAFVPNHPTQGLQDMTLDLSTYTPAQLEHLRECIEEEKTKRERKVPFEVYRIDGLELQVISKDVPTQFNTWLRLSAEAKLRAAGGGRFSGTRMGWVLASSLIREMKAAAMGWEVQGAIYFETQEQAISAYATLTPDEQAALFGFGEG